MILPLLVASEIIRVTVEPDQVLNRISPAMYGACIEDVNHEIYGGLYGQRLFGESFEEPAPGTSPAGWMAWGGRWSPDGPGVHVRAGDGPKLVRAGELADGTVETGVVVSNDMGENAGLLVRVSKESEGADAFDGYEISLGARDRRLILGKHRQNFQSLQTVAAPVVPGRWHRLRVVLAGPRIRVYLDGEASPRIDFMDRDRPLLAGKVALRTWRADASFRGFNIDGAECPVSFATPGVSGLWDPVGAGKFSLEGRAFNGALCQRVENPGEGSVGVANLGLNRWGVSVRAGKPMTGRVALRGDVGEVTVGLQSSDGSRTYASQKIVVGPQWGLAGFRLVPKATDPGARFVVTTSRRGAFWVDQASLFDEEGFKGLAVRGDIARKMVEGGLTFLRYGGTMVNVPGYRWKNMIGDRDRRPPYVGHWYPASSNGFGIFDFLRFCEAAKMGAAFAISAEETPEDAADLADYLTAPVGSPWGRRRALDGHPAPYRPEYIEVGNEEAIGSPTAEAMAHYAERFRLLAKAIHGRNPALKLVCSAWWVADSPAMKTVFDAVDGEAAAWDLHFWCDEANAGTGIDRDLDWVAERFKGWNPKTHLKVVVFEENGNRHDLQRALGHATTLNATRRHGDFVLADCAANGLQPWRQNDNGWDQGQIFFSPDRVWGTPPFEVQRMLAEGQLPLRVAARAEGLDVLASRSEDGKRVALTVVNPSTEAVTVAFSVKGMRVLRGETVFEGGRKGLAVRGGVVRLEGRSVSLVTMAGGG